MSASATAGGSSAPGHFEIQVLPDLIDFSQVSYAKIFLSYSDPDNGIDVNREVVFVADAEDPVTWKVDVKDDHKHQFRWRAIFFMTDGSQRETAPLTTEELTIVPRLS